MNLSSTLPLPTNLLEFLKYADVAPVEGDTELTICVLHEAIDRFVIMHRSLFGRRGGFRFDPEFGDN